MAKTPVWQLPYPALADPADIVGVDGVDDLAARLEVLLSQLRAAGSIPGEVKLWPGSALPNLGTYGHWVWADGAAYASVTYPLAAGNIAAQWRTFAGVADPGAGQFRVPDLRGATPAGLDAMPGGARANRISRAAAAVLAAFTGEEVHSLATAEMPAHAHGVNETPHIHGIPTGGGGGSGYAPRANPDGFSQNITGPAATGITIQSNGGGGAHENLQPTVFVPYIVKLDD